MFNEMSSSAAASSRSSEQWPICPLLATPLVIPITTYTYSEGAEVTEQYSPMAFLKLLLSKARLVQVHSKQVKYPPKQIECPSNKQTIDVNTISIMNNSFNEARKTYQTMKEQGQASDFEEAFIQDFVALTILTQFLATPNNPDIDREVVERFKTILSTKVPRLAADCGIQLVGAEISKKIQELSDEDKSTADEPSEGAPLLGGYASDGIGYGGVDAGTLIQAPVVVEAPDGGYTSIPGGTVTDGEDVEVLTHVPPVFEFDDPTCYDTMRWCCVRALIISGATALGVGLGWVWGGLMNCMVSYTCPTDWTYSYSPMYQDISPDATCWNEFCDLSPTVDMYLYQQLPISGEVIRSFAAKLILHPMWNIGCAAGLGGVCCLAATVFVLYDWYYGEGMIDGMCDSTEDSALPGPGPA